MTAALHEQVHRVQCDGLSDVNPGADTHWTPVLMQGVRALQNFFLFFASFYLQGSEK